MDEQRRVDLAGAHSLEDARVGADGNDDRVEAGQEQSEHDVPVGA